MSAVVALWKRFGGLLRFSGVPAGCEAAIHSNGNGLTHSRRVPAMPIPPMRAARRESLFSRVFGGRGRTEEALSQVSQALDVLGAAVAEQSSRLDVLEAGVERSARVLARILEGQDAQSEVLERVAGEMSVTSRHAESLASSLGGLPGALRAAHDSIQDLGLQIRLARENGEAHTQLTQRVMTAAEAGRDLATGQVERLQRLQAELRQHAEQTHLLLRRQNTRLSIALALASLLACAGVGTTIALIAT